MKITKKQLKKIIQEELNLLEDDNLGGDADPLAKRQQKNLRAYTNADPKEKAAISDLETALLTVAANETLLSLPDVVRAIKLLNTALKAASSAEAPPTEAQPGAAARTAPGGRLSEAKIRQTIRHLLKEELKD